MFDFVTPVDARLRRSPRASSSGVKFTASVNGVVTGVRFYKAAANTGAHVGSLWSSSGTLLASGTFTNETASGWQTLTFSSPVTVTAGTHLRRRVPRAERPLLVRRRRVRLDWRHERTADRPGQRHEHRQRRVRVQRHFHVPVQQLQRHQLLGRRRFPARRFRRWRGRSGGSIRRVGDARHPAGAGVVDGAVEQRRRPITVYTDHADGTAGTPVQVNGSLTSATLTGLTNGTVYTFTVDGDQLQRDGSRRRAPSAAVDAGGHDLRLRDPVDGPTPATPRASSSGSKFIAERQRHGHRHSLLQGVHEHRHPRRQPVDLGRNLAGLRHVHQRDRLGMADADVLLAGRHHGWHDLRRRLSRARTATTRPPGGAFSSSGVTNGPLTALANGQPARQRRVCLHGVQHVPVGNSFNAANYWVDVLFQPGGSSVPGPPTQRRREPGVEPDAGHLDAAGDQRR